MGHEGEVIRKNYYIHMGKSQGVKKESVVDILWTISVQNSYDNISKLAS